MASTILSRTISAVVDKRIVLLNSQFGRPHGVTPWNVLRVGLRLDMNNTGANVGSFVFFVGLCSGTTNMFFDAVTTNALGAYMGGLMTYSAGPPIKYSPSVSWAYSRTGITDATPATTLGSGIMQADATLAQRKMLILEFTKGSPNFSIQPVLMWDGTGTVDCQLSDLLAQIVQPIPAFTDHGAGNLQAIAFSEGPGVLDCVNIGYNQATPTIEISDLAIARMS